MKQTKRTARVGLVVALLALLIGLIGLTAAPVVDASSLDRYLERQMQKARVPGLATAIVVGDELVQAGGYGWANPEDGSPMTPDTLVFLSSVAKPLTATIAMRLVDRRQLSLHTNVNQYLPFEVRNPHFPDQAITLRQLLTHSSSIRDKGFYDHKDELVVAGDWPGSLTQFLVDYLTPDGRYYSAQNSFRQSPPGEASGYSNVAVALIGALVESVTGEPFETASHELLFDPLGMTESSWFLSNLDADHVAVPCSWTGDGFEAYQNWGLAPYPSGQLRTSVVQLANFMRLHLNQGKFEGRRLLKRKRAKMMVRLQSVGLDRHWGLGFEVAEDDEHRSAFHGGGSEGSTTALWLGLDEGIGVVVLTNGEAWAHGRSAVNAFFKIRDRLIKQARRIARRQVD